MFHVKLPFGCGESGGAMVADRRQSSGRGFTWNIGWSS
nr:hypothetical protein [Kibdelosporangium sp. MJ126-NF4]